MNHYFFCMSAPADNPFPDNGELYSLWLVSADVYSAKYLQKIINKWINKINKSFDKTYRHRKVIWFKLITNKLTESKAHYRTL